MSQSPPPGKTGIPRTGDTDSRAEGIRPERIWSGIGIEQPSIASG